MTFLVLIHNLTWPLEYVHFTPSMYNTKGDSQKEHTDFQALKYLASVANKAIRSRPSFILSMCWIRCLRFLEYADLCAYFQRFRRLLKRASWLVMTLEKEFNSGSGSKYVNILELCPCVGVIWRHPFRLSLSFC